MNGPPVVLEVKGELACFTRPEAKVERYSYPVITPSAARAVFEAIHWKPRYRWQVTRIEVFQPPRYIALRRNEVKNKGPAERTVRQWMEGRSAPEPLWADGSREMLGTDQAGRTQRQTLALKGVCYRLHARPVPWPGHEAEAGPLAEQFKRRARRGQCIYQPYLGCREFPAWFRLVEPDESPHAPCALDLDVGWMVYDVFDLSRPGTSTDAPAVSVFRAQVKAGVLDVPPYESPEVRKPMPRGLPC
jgi:CRISPR-associated protein Cas5d